MEEHVFLKLRTYYFLKRLAFSTGFKQLQYQIYTCRTILLETPKKLVSVLNLLLILRSTLLECLKPLRFHWIHFSSCDLNLSMPSCQWFKLDIHYFRKHYNINPFRTCLNVMKLYTSNKFNSLTAATLNYGPFRLKKGRKKKVSLIHLWGIPGHYINSPSSNLLSVYHDYQHLTEEAG